MKTMLVLFVLGLSAQSFAAGEWECIYQDRDGNPFWGYGRNLEAAKEDAVNSCEEQSDEDGCRMYDCEYISDNNL